MDSGSFLLTLQNTVYWDGTYVMHRTEQSWAYQCDFCFSVTAQKLGDVVAIDLCDCAGLVARFSCFNESDPSSPSEIADAYRQDLANATATISFITQGVDSDPPPWGVAF